MADSPRIAVIRGDGIGADVTDATLAIAECALASIGAPAPTYDDIDAGAAFFAETGNDIEPDGETRAGAADGCSSAPSDCHRSGMPTAPKYRRICGSATGSSSTPACGLSVPIRTRRSDLRTRVPQRSTW